MKSLVGEDANATRLRTNNGRDRNNKSSGFVRGRHEGVLLKVAMIHLFIFEPLFIHRRTPYLFCVSHNTQIIQKISAPLETKEHIVERCD